eukprot:CAMPEP_0172184634 /NCGR_PEP_ID=MMETSP1050-20130122/19693_1 /TAXON_ID=233186 /ORGANISM="Cryptomonas curvata, Strain CCAP979/52" /LENGTH=221 /DNA_ID=CAMNT_0012858471 /DNA_START=1 /DNA_END=665 /DNA_ORIENTATION=-
MGCCEGRPEKGPSKPENFASSSTSAPLNPREQEERRLAAAAAAEQRKNRFSGSAGGATAGGGGVASASSGQDGGRLDRIAKAGTAAGIEAIRCFNHKLSLCFLNSQLPGNISSGMPLISADQTVCSAIDTNQRKTPPQTSIGDSTCSSARLRRVWTTAAQLAAADSHPRCAVTLAAAAAGPSSTHHTTPPTLPPTHAPTNAGGAEARGPAQPSRAGACSAV